MAKKMRDSLVSEAIAELNKVRKDWLKRPGVTAVDVGYKIRDKGLTDELAIRVHVRRKLPLEALQEYERFSVSGDPAKVGAFSVDVIEAEYVPARWQMAVAQPLEAEAVNRHSRLDPLVGGISVGNPRVTAGTLGAIVWDRTDGSVCMLSNWHVLCGAATCTAGEPIYQPGVYDGGTAADKVAELMRWRLDSDADAALAKLSGARGYSRDILELSPISGVEEPALGMNVVKSGRTTGRTEGLIDGVSASVSIDYGGGTTQTFHDQMHIVPRPPWPAVDYEVSKGGDSGSVWVNEATGNAIGLHFAGESDPSPSAENAMANRMIKVAELLNFSFTPLFSPPPVVDDQWRDVIRRVLCRYLPWLCYPWSLFPQRPGAVPSPGTEDVAVAHPTLPAYPAPAVDLDRLIDEIMEEMRRNR
jgi:endonuclease G